MRRVLHKAIKPDLRSKALFGRVVFGGASVALGAYVLMGSDTLQYAAPSFLVVPELWIIIAGVILVLTGLMIITDTGVRKSAKTIALILAFIALFVYLPQGAYSKFLLCLGFIGGALLLNTLAHARDITDEFKKDAEAKQ